VSASVRVDFNHFGRIAAGLRPRAAQAVAKAAHDIEGHAKAAAPIDTGFLASTIRARALGAYEWEVAVGAHYGIYVELGTRFMAAQPYFAPAIERVRPSFEAAVRELVRASG
jgi:HK97 gp10 family phage protein